MPITIDKPSKYFDTKLYTGTGSAQSITGLEFAPKFTWVKNRSGANSNALFDIVRGAGYRLSSNETGAEVNNTAYFTAFNSDGFSVALAGGETNVSGNNYATWNWRGSDSSAVTNNSGTISSTVSANTTSGFSIVSYTGTGSNATVGHGLGVAPKMVIVKSRSNSTDWIVGNTNIGWTKLLRLNTTDAQETNNYFNDTAPTSSVFSLGTTVNVNGSGYTYVAYCFADVKGFSKMGSWIGNGSTDGTFVYTGFKPSFIMIRNSNVAGTGWSMWDSKRNTYNLVNTYLQANGADAEGTQAFADFLSNGIKIRDSNSFCNGSGNTIIYMAFAENPFVSSKGIPTTAR